MQCYEVNIDFDEAQQAWMANKKKLPNCTYVYVCGHITKKGTPCQNSQNCKLHKRLKNSKKNSSKNTMKIQQKTLLDEEIKEKLEIHKNKYNKEFYNHVKGDLKDINSSKTIEILNSVKVRVSNFLEMCRLGLGWVRVGVTLIGFVENDQTEFLDLLLKKIEEKKQEIEK